MRLSTLLVGRAHSVPRWAALAAAVCIAATVFLLIRSAAFWYGISIPRPAMAAVAVGVGAGCVVAALLCRSRTRGGALAVLALCGVILGSMLPPVRDDFPAVEVVATGERNPLSAGSEVWLPDMVPGRVFFEGKGWERRDNRVSISYLEQPNSARLKGRWHDGEVVRFSTHPHSGIAIVRIGQVERRVDLYSAEQSTISLELPAGKSSLRGHASWFAFALLPVLGLLALGGLVLVLPKPWLGVALSGVVLATLAMTQLARQSYPGPLELLAYGSGELSQVKADIGGGMFDFPVGDQTGGRSVQHTVAVAQSQPAQLSVASGELREIRTVGTAWREPGSSSHSGLPICMQGHDFHLFERLGDKTGMVKISVGGGTVSEFAPHGQQVRTGSERAFLVVRCLPGQVVLYQSNAYVNISPWTLPYYRTRALRLLDSAGTPLSVLQLSSDKPVGFIPLPTMSEGSVEGPRELERPDTRAFAMEKALAACLVGLIPFALWFAGKNVSRARRHWRRGQRALAVLFYFAPPVWIGAIMAIQWPGTLGWDAYSPFVQMHTGILTLWYGVGYPLVIGALMQLVSPLAVAVLQCILVALLVQTVALRCLDAIDTGGRWIGLAICLLLPCTIIAWGATVHLRDAMNGVLVATFAVGWFYTTVVDHAERRTSRWPCQLLLGALAVALVLLRVDNLVLVVVILACAPWLERRHRKGNAAIAASVSIVLVCVFANAMVERAVFGSRDQLVAEKNIYKETAVISPLVGFLVDPDSRIPDPEKSALARDLSPMLDVEKAKEHWRPFHIIWWHEASKDKPPPSNEAITALHRHLARMIFQDPWRFLQMRTAMFLSMLGHQWVHVPPAPPASNAEVLLDRLRMPQDRDSQATANLLGFSGDRRVLRPLSDALFGFYNRIATTVPQLVVCLGLACFFRWVPATAAVALALLARAGVFYLLAPADVFLYLFDMHILGLLLPGMAAYEFSKRRQFGNARIKNAVGRRETGRAWFGARRGNERSGLQ